MTPRARAMRCRIMRDSHAKCVRIHRRKRSLPMISSRFQPKSIMALTLLFVGKGSGRIQPFATSTMKVTQAAAANLCPAPADRGGLYCTQSSRLLPIASWLSISFQPPIRSVLDVSSLKGGREGFRRKRRVSARELELRGLGRGLGGTQNRLFCWPDKFCATRDFLGFTIKKQLARSG
jgi:hypothetical protein